MENLPDRLIVARKSLSKSQKEMAAILAISFMSWQNYELGKSVPGGSVFEGLVRLGFNANWLLAGEGPMRRGSYPAEGAIGDGNLARYTPGDLGDDYVIPRYNVEASAGGGAMINTEQIVDYLAFKTEWLRREVGIAPANAVVISVTGDSMEPNLSEGDLILVDTGVQRFENDAIYVLQTGGSLLVKRVQVKLDGTVIVKSDNNRYDPEMFRGEEVERLIVVGRMVRRVVR